MQDYTFNIAEYFDSCQRCKYANQISYGSRKNINTSRPKEQLSVDLCGPLPKSKYEGRYIFVIMSTYLKFGQIYALPRATTTSIIKTINKYILKFGKIDRIQSNHGTQFQNQRWIIYLQNLNIVPIFSPIRIPHSNMMERVNKEVMRCLQTYCHNNNKKWARYLPLVTEWINEIPHETIGYTPNEIYLGKKNPRFWQDILKLDN